MHRLTGPFALLACLLVGAQVTAQSEAERKAFQQARASGTAEGWEDFLARNPTSKLVPMARENLDRELHDLALQTLRLQEGPAGQQARLSAVEAAKTVGKLYRRCQTPDGSDRIFLVWDDATFAAAVATGKIEQFRAYLLRFPGGKHSKQVKPAIEAGAWRRAQAANTVAAYRGFVAEFGRSSYAIKARLAISRIEFEEACKANTVEGYEYFLARHRAHEPAMLRLAKLMYRHAKDSGELKDWKVFRKRFQPKAFRSRSFAKKNKILNKMLIDSSKEIERLLYARIETAPTLEACDEYLAEFPRGAHRARVLAHRETCHFEKVVREGDAKICLGYLKKYRKSDRVSDVIDRLDQLIFRKLPLDERFKDFAAYIGLYPRQRPSLVAKMEPYMYDWAKRVGSERSYLTYLRWQSNSKYWVPGARRKRRPSAIPPTPHAAEIQALVEPFLWKKVRDADWHTTYRDYLGHYPDGPHVKEAKARLAFLAKNKAIPRLSAPVSLNAIASRWKWTTKFSETGGKVGYKVTGFGWIYSGSGKKYGVKSGFTRRSARQIGRGSVTLKPGGNATDSYWCRGKFSGGRVVFTWTGEDAGGHRITLTERVNLK